jgi:hypothetical protein
MPTASGRSVLGRQNSATPMKGPHGAMAMPRGEGNATGPSGLIVRHSFGACIHWMWDAAGGVDAHAALPVSMILRLKLSPSISTISTTTADEEEDASWRNYSALGARVLLDAIRQLSSPKLGSIPRHHSSGLLPKGHLV